MLPSAATPDALVVLEESTRSVPESHKTPEHVKPKLSLDDLDAFKSPTPAVSPSSKQQLHQKAKKTSGTSPLRLSPNQRRRRRKVKFNKVVHNRRIPHLNDLSDQQIVATWIQPEDYLDIRERCIATVRKMMKGSLTEAELENECPRGLEGKTRDGSNVRREHKFESIAAVLDEQAIQWDENVLDEEAIMEVYTYFTIPCAQDAHEVALKDAEEVCAYQHAIGDESSSQDVKAPAEAQPTTSAPVSPVNAVAPGVVDRLKDILYLRPNKAALLHDIERFVYNESAMERRRKVYEKPSGSALASQLRQYFSTRGASGSSKGADDVPSLASTSSGSQSSDSTIPEDDDSSSSSSGHAEDAHEGCATADVFTTQLQNHFSARTKRQALLKSIESRGYFEEKETATTNSIVTVAANTSSSVAAMASSNVAAISSSVGSMLQDIFSARSMRKAMVDELKASSHHRRRNE